jgi:hypothetical protein
VLDKRDRACAELDDGDPATLNSSLRGINLLPVIKNFSGKRILVMSKTRELRNIFRDPFETLSPINFIKSIFLIKKGYTHVSFILIFRDKIINGMNNHLCSPWSEPLLDWGKGRLDFGFGRLSEAASDEARNDLRNPNRPQPIIGLGESNSSAIEGGEESRRYLGVCDFLNEGEKRFGKGRIRTAEREIKSC